MSSLVGVLTASMLVLLFGVQYRFRSDSGIQRTASYHALAHTHGMRTGEVGGMHGPGDTAVPVDME